MNTGADLSKLAMFLVCLIPAGPSVASLAILNYDRDPDLAAALEYDRGETTDPSKADRDLAEQYYLKYLEKDLPSFQKARVYQRLGGLFTVESDPPRGIMPDREKGAGYLAKALELEPNRIDMATIRARTLLASSGLLSREEYLRKGLDLYDWLLSVDDARLRTLWLPIEPNQTAIHPTALQSLQNTVPMARHTTAVNAIDAAAHMPDREARLAAIIQRFPKTEIADLAQRRLDTQLEELADRAVRHVESSSSTLPDSNSPGRTAPSPHPQPPVAAVLQGRLTPQDGPPAKQGSRATASANASPIHAGPQGLRTACLLGLCVVLTGGVLLHIARRKRPPTENHGEN
jgi:hypothetical protein